MSRCRLARCGAAALAALGLAVAPAVAQTSTPLPPEQAAIEAHVQFLAADSLRGREAGTRDFDVAADYVASEMASIGLTPGGTGGGWFQPVTLVTYRPAEKARWTLTRGGKAIPFAFGSEFLNRAVPASPDFRAEAEVVFAGYGLVLPDRTRDDYAGLDVRGRIVALLSGVPSGVSPDAETLFLDDEQKARLAAARGARAVLILESNARRLDYPFEAVAPYWDAPDTGIAGPDGTVESTAGSAPVVGYVSRKGAQALFDGSPIAWRDVLRAEAKGRRLPMGPLGATLAVANKTHLTRAESHNVIGLIPGTDPVLRAEHIVLSAHLDHVGMGETVGDDRIYNGAMDNAVGVSILLEVARQIRRQPTPPRRSILIVALTGEEKGLLGSRHFAKAPGVAGRLVADINVDMPILTYPLKDLVVLGGERSTLGPTIARAAKAEGLGVAEDPHPEEMFFVRSDHYSFVQAGVPAVSIDTGPGGAGAAAIALFLEKHYHKPSDQIDLPFDWQSAAKYQRVVLGAARALADADAAPRWNRGDFFGLAFGGAGAAGGR